MSNRMLEEFIGDSRANHKLWVDRLSDRELEVFRFIGQGQGTRRIAEKLHLSIKTIECYREPRAGPGDKILLSGTIGDHGIAIMSRRENLEFESTIESDTAPLHSLVAAMLEASPHIHCLRDPTRGGVATTLNEIAKSSGVGMVIEERQIPVRDTVQGACEILGLDPLYVANEGKLLAIVAAEAAAAVLRRMRDHPLGRDAQMIGEVICDNPGMVLMKTAIGGTIVVDVLFGEQLPRIC